MTREQIARATILILAFLIGGEASAGACAPRDQVVALLTESYGETPRGMGLTSGDGILEIYASEETGSWSALVTSPDGNACLVAAGQMWEPAPVGDPA